MSKVIFYSRPDGGVSVVHPAWNDALRPADDTDDALLARCMERLPANAINPVIGEDTDIPTDRTFRAAWRQAEKGVAVDMAAARDVWLDISIRPARDAELRRLDVELLKAVESGDQASIATIAAKKQVLRDLPVTIKGDLDAAQTPDDLKTIRVEIGPVRIRSV